MAVTATICESAWSIGCLAIPSRLLLSEMREGLPPVSGVDIFLSYSGVPALRFCGFLVTAKRNINKTLAFCPLGSGLELAGVLWRQEVRRQLLCALNIATSLTEACTPNVIDLRPSDHGKNGIPPWLYGLQCVPLTYTWDGTLCHPTPFSSKLFTEMARQPEARKWIEQTAVKEPSELSDISASLLDRPRLPPRQASVLVGLQSGLSEKEIARSLQLSRHTVHTYVKSIYRAYQVNSRGELLAAFIK